MSTNGAEERALETMRAELSTQSTPSLPWDSMERELFAKLEQAKAEKPRTTARGRAAFALAAAAAAALVLGVAAERGALPTDATGHLASVRFQAPESVAFLPGSEVEHDLSTLHVGDGVEAGDVPLVLTRRGVVRVTLEPKTRVFVVASGSGANDALVLGLDRGSLRAEVTSRSSRDAVVETFAVDVDRTRIAAHGTEFRVIRHDAAVEVDLFHGSVAVGLSGRSAVTTGRLLVGRARASFSLDGGSSAQMLSIEEHALRPAMAATRKGLSELNSASPTPTPSVAELPPHPHALRPAPSLPPPEIAPTAEPLPPVEEKPQERALSRASVQAGLASCFERHYGSADPSVRLSVSGKVILSLSDDGSVGSVRFDPPLEAPFMNCVFGSLRPGRFTEASGPISVSFSLGK